MLRLPLLAASSLRQAALALERTAYVCTQCGDTDRVVVESEMPNHKDGSSVEKQRFPYKRQNHLSECLNQFQAKESTEIPADVYEAVINELKFQRLFEDLKTIKYTKQKIIIKTILKRLRFQAYYEHVPFIISKITKKPPPTITRDIEEKVKQMFKNAQEPFKKHCPGDRINFLNYSYVLNKIFKILDMVDIADCFNLLKSRDKLRSQDVVWKKICDELDWQFHPSI